MKIIRIDDNIHTQLKKEAKQRGHTLQYWAEIKLSSPTAEVRTGYSSPVQEFEEPTILPDSQDWQPHEKNTLGATPGSQRMSMDEMIAKGIIKRGI